MKELAVLDRPDGIPFCEKCQRRVDHFSITTPVEPVPGFEAFGSQRHTGEVIVTIECHGEKWVQSNWAGKLNHEQ